MPSSRRALQLTEAQFQRQVVQLAKLMNWMVYHTQHSIHSTGGYPDLCLVRERVVFIELKVGNRKPTPDQTMWLERLRAAGASAHLFYPSDWDQIEQLLR